MENQRSHKTKTCEGKLIPFLPDYNITPLNAYTIYPQTRHLPHKTRYLIDFLKETFGGKPYWD
jgi:DNA-binding transcriptional LysR family regulator